MLWPIGFDAALGVDAVDGLGGNIAGRPGGVPIDAAGVAGRGAEIGGRAAAGGGGCVAGAAGGVTRDVETAGCIAWNGTVGAG